MNVGDKWRSLPCPRFPLLNLGETRYECLPWHWQCRTAVTLAQGEGQGGAPPPPRQFRLEEFLKETEGSFIMIRGSLRFSPNDFLRAAPLLGEGKHQRYPPREKLSCTRSVALLPAASANLAGRGLLVEASVHET